MRADARANRPIPRAAAAPSAVPRLLSPFGMGWIALFLAITVVGALGTVASIESVRFARSVAADVRGMGRGAIAAAPLDRSRLPSLPGPVRRYLAIALGDRATPVAAVRLRQAGSFRTRLDGGWAALRGEQYLRGAAPAFVWWGRVTVAPGVWVDAHDRSVDGGARMLVSAESTVTLADRKGAELDASALQRLLGELVWLPAVLLDERYVTWEAIDDRRARATLRVGVVSAMGIFTFGDDDMPISFHAVRYRDTGDGRSILTPFVGEYGDYRRVGGLDLPHRIVGSWMIDARPISFIRLDVVDVQLDRMDPF